MSSHVYMEAPLDRIPLSDSNDQYVLEVRDGSLHLVGHDRSKGNSISVDFVSGKSTYRRKYGGGRKQAIARAVGLKKGTIPAIVDATAGLGRDAFVLASIGCQVHMIERSSIIAALLEDGLKRARLDEEIGSWVSQRMFLINQDSRTALCNLPFQPDVVYLDPMYPVRQKTALVKKEMRVFQSIIGGDLDAGQLLDIACKAAKNRVVVKRPAYADCLAGQTPNTSIELKKNRFDIYLTDC